MTSQGEGIGSTPSAQMDGRIGIPSTANNDAAARQGPDGSSVQQGTGKLVAAESLEEVRSEGGTAADIVVAAKPVVGEKMIISIQESEAGRIAQEFDVKASLPHC